MSPKTRPLKVYLADLTHMGAGVATETFPLNIGLIASYAKKQFGSAVELTLFKYPGDLRDALRAETPDVLACSNYTWNSNLAYHFVQLAKSLDPEILTVWGGTNYPFKSEQQRKFLETRPALDVHIYYEGEVAFSRLLAYRLSARGVAKLLEAPIDGCQFIEKKNLEFVEGVPVPRIKILDEIPSPYATGLLDKFFDGKLTPLMETARGCPFSCNFCNAGGAYFNKVNLFSDDYVREEMSYVARMASQAGVGHMTLADNNFGMIPRDSKTAALVYALKQKYDWPKTMTAWTGKNSKERVIDVTRLLGDVISISMSVQAMDKEVLKNIERDNIKTDHYCAITEELNAQGRPQHAELIVPLPGETLASYFRSVGELLDTNVGSINTHTLQLLHGTPYKDDSDFIERWGYQNVKYRVVPLDFGIYDGTCILDVDPVAVDTNTMSYSDYVESRKLTLLIDVCYNGSVFQPLRQYLRSKNIPFSVWVMGLYARLDELPDPIQTIFKSFEQETGDELWNSEAELVEHYSKRENYEKLVRGDAGGNVLFHHKVWLFSTAAEIWADAVFRLSRNVIAEFVDQPFAQELEELRRFVQCQLRDIFTFEDELPVIEEQFAYDILGWMSRRDAPPMSSVRTGSPVQYRFYFNDDQAAIRKDAKNRYGDTLSGRIKLVQRTNYHKLLRKVAAAQTSSLSSLRSISQ